MRVKVAFEELGRHKKDQLARLESVAGSGPKEAAVMPGIYPMNVVAKVECYVCGFVAETKAMPNTCPNCGAARYAFEKEISLSKAWEIAADAGRKSATLLGESAAHAGGRLRAKHGGVHRVRRLRGSLPGGHSLGHGVGRREGVDGEFGLRAEGARAVPRERPGDAQPVRQTGGGTWRLDPARGRAVGQPRGAVLGRLRRELRAATDRPRGREDPERREGALPDPRKG